MSQLREIAIEIVNAINAATLSAAVVAVRTAALGFDSEDLTPQPKCYVRLASSIISDDDLGTRDARSRDVEYEIVLAAKGPSRGVVVADVIAELAEEIEDLLHDTLNSLPTQDAVLIESAIDYAFDRQQLREHGVAQSLITVTYRVA